MIDAQVQALLDKQAIREVLDRYARGIDRLDAEVVTSAYHADAIDDRGTMGAWRGDEVGPHMVERMRESMASTQHHVTNVVITIDGDVAGVESYTLGVHAPITGDGKRRMLTSGRCLDRFERREGEWRIARRQMASEMVRIMSVEGEIDAGDVARRDRTDPSYDLLG